MPNYPDSVRVRMSGGGEVEWMVDGVGTCRQCTAEIFWCPTGNYKPDGSPKLCPVDVETDEEGLHVSHWATCSHPDRFNAAVKPESSRRPSPRDLAAGDD